jgi:hypothetical protein
VSVRRLAVVASALAVALACAGNALAAEVTRLDDRGRTMHFDVRAEGVDVDLYADALRRAPHGDEISTVTIRIVSLDELRETCGRGASGCYSGRSDVVVVPAADDSLHTLLHEYGHHIDRSYGQPGVPEPNGTPQWWRARGMARLVALRAVARDYSLGWDRSIGEVFAEDYAQIALGDGYRIGWLAPPDDTVRRALLADLGLAEPPPATAAARPALQPVVVSRQGTLAPGSTVAVPFGLLGPGRQVTFTAELSGGSGGARARIEIDCGRPTRR